MTRLLPCILLALYIAPLRVAHAEDDPRRKLFIMKDFYDPQTQRKVRHQWRVYKVPGANNEAIRVKHGREDYFYTNGRGMQAAFYRDGKLEGPFIKWSPEGQILIKGGYDAGLKHGIFEFYRNDGTLRLIAEFDHGERHGEFTMYDSRGTVRVKGTYNHGKAHGTTTKYYSDKALRESISYVNGVKDGTEKHMFFNGKPESEIEWKDGKKNGQEVYWHPTEGYKQFVFTWKDNKRHGTSSEFIGPGKPRLILTFAANMLDGPVQVWTSDGKLMTDGVYRKNKPYAGVFRQPGDLPGQMFEYRYNDGNLVDGIYYVNGVPFTGELTRKYTGTKTERISPFVDGRLHGVEKTYFISGGLRSEATWHNNQLSGLYVEYYEDGQKGWEVAVNQGKKDGPETIWSERGFVASYGLNRAGKPYKGFVPVLIDLLDGEQVWAIRNFNDGREVAMTFVHPDLPTPDPQGVVERPKISIRELPSVTRGQQPTFNEPTRPTQPTRPGDPPEPDENDADWEVIELMD